MSEEFEIALELMGVGMFTVFIILLFVVLLGNMIIAFVNRFFPEVIDLSKNKISGSDIGAKKTAVIVAAVKAVTQGVGQVMKIERK